ncbi:trypsin-like serine peptidase [Williamsia deligens]|uniref:Trypsin-like serine peptidase n=1 Tax=Williamsia deligens TaxID=321325 RepID=A0ABW3G9N1_9NOCA|nr:trypsin-like serine protease [Williamsia deligens]MCP2192443.1 Trypsin [Williamsia deligens]
MGAAVNARAARALLVIVVLALVAGLGGAASSTAVDVQANRRIGPVFLDGDNRHTCTAATVHSTHGDLMVTAAHCLTGIRGPITVAPGYDHGRAPYGQWTVSAVYLDPDVSAEPDVLDFAVLRVSDRAGRSLESVTGRGWSPSPYRPGLRIRVLGYGAGVGDSPVGCRARTATVEGIPTIRCRGLVDGTSGSPWLAGRSLVGIVGGFRQGGCVSFISHSPPLIPRLVALIERADRAGPGDTPPDTSPDDC